MIYVLGAILLIVGGAIYWATRPETETENDTD